jgi:hypothetical protein
MRLYECVSLAWGLLTFLHNGMRGIQVVVSVFGWGMVNGFPAGIGGESTWLGSSQEACCIDDCMFEVGFPLQW